MRLLKVFQWAVIAILAAVVIVQSGRGVAVETEAAAMQDPASLDRRISMLEQRFYTLESSINRLQQFVSSQRSTNPSSSNANDREMTLLSQELQRLHLRVTEIECGLVKVDERTASARRSGEPKSTDPCRMNPGPPLRLSARP
jgi:uncharacterized protein YlxW (UPF0749 family)